MIKRVISTGHDVLLFHQDLGDEIEDTSFDLSEMYHSYFDLRQVLMDRTQMITCIHMTRFSLLRVSRDGTKVSFVAG